jgi:hypothetical protein
MDIFPILNGIDPTNLVLEKTENGWRISQNPFAELYY